MSKQDMEALLALLERALGPSWRDVVEYLVRANPESDIARALQNGDHYNAVKGVDQAAEMFAADTQQAYATAGRTAAKWLDSEVTPLVRFDVGNPIAVRWAEANKLELVREITQEQRGVIRAVITEGLRAGENPLEIAKDLRASIGLTEAQAKIVANYRAALEAGQYASALQRELSHGQSDRVIATAMRDQRQLTQAQIDTAVDRYRANWVTLRAQTIARTEALRVTHQGSEDGLRMAIARGDVAADKLTRKWNHYSGGKSARDYHEHMQVGECKVGESFVSGRGVSLRYPGDPAAGAGEVINCRCVVSTRLAA